MRYGGQYLFISIFERRGMRRNYAVFILLSLLLLQAMVASAQRKAVVPDRLYVLEDTGRTLQPAAVLQLYRKGQFAALPQPFLNPGFTRSVFWIAVVADTSRTNEVLLINNANINRIEWYSIPGNADTVSLPIAITGDWYPFSQRPILYNYFALPLQTRAPLYLLKIDKHFESLQAPLQLLTRDELAQTAAQESLINGLLAGVVLLMVLFGLFLFATTRDGLYLWYALYVFCLSMWIWSDKGLGFQYLWPSSSFFPSRSRPFFLGLTVFTSISFLQLFIGQGKESWWYRPFKIVQGLCVVMLILVLWPFDYTQTGSAMLWFLRSITLLSIVYAFLYFASLIEKIRKGNRMALIYMAATLVLFTFSMAESMSHFGQLLLPPFLAKFGMFTGEVLEMIIIMFGMAARFNTYRKDREALLAEKNQQQKALTDTIVSVQENERKVLADQLHDEIGSLLSLASLNLDAAQEKGGLESVAKIGQASEVLNIVSHTVRTISHQLTPVAIEKYGFRHAIENLAIMANQSGKIRIELVLVGFEREAGITVNFRNTLYRIVQELLQNVLKHAAAAHVLIQLVEHEDSISLMVEDDGAGMPVNERGTFFLRSVQSKVDYLEGTLVIESAENSGTLVNIDIPINLNQPDSTYALSTDNSR